MGKHRSLITIVIGLVLLAILIDMASVAFMADVPTPKPVPGIPTKTPPPSGGGGGGGYTPPQDVYPKIIPIKNSTGDIIGNVTAKSASEVVFEVLQTVNVKGYDIVVLIQGNLVNIPPDPKMDVVGEVPDGSRLPAELTLKNLLAQFNLTRFSNGWDVQHGSLKITVKMPKALAENADLSKSLLIRYDGTMYELLYPSVGGPDANGTITFTVVSPNEAFKYNGFSEYILMTSLLPTPTPTSVPSATPTPTPTGGLEPLTILLALILVVVVVGAFVIYFWMQRRQ